MLIFLSAIYAYSHNKKPPEKKILLFKSGFELEGKFTSWKNCEAFWMLTSTEYTELHIEKKTGFMRHIVIQTGDQNPFLVRQVMLSLLPEHADEKEKLLDIFTRICKL